MTEDQKKRLRVEAHIALEDAREEASALRQKAKVASDSLNAICEWLSRCSRAFDPQFETRFNCKALIAFVDINDQRFRDAMDFDSVIELRDQLVNAHGRVEELTSRLMEVKSSS